MDDSSPDSKDVEPQQNSENIGVNSQNSKALDGKSQISQNMADSSQNSGQSPMTSNEITANESPLTNENFKPSNKVVANIISNLNQQQIVNGLTGISLYPFTVQKLSTNLGVKKNVNLNHHQKRNPHFTLPSNSKQKLSKMVPNLISPSSPTSPTTPTSPIHFVNPLRNVKNSSLTLPMVNSNQIPSKSENFTPQENPTVPSNSQTVKPLMNVNSKQNPLTNMDFNISNPNHVDSNLSQKTSINLNSNQKPSTNPFSSTSTTTQQIIPSLNVNSNSKEELQSKKELQKNYNQKLLQKGNETEDIISPSTSTTLTQTTKEKPNNLNVRTRLSVNVHSLILFYQNQLSSLSAFVNSNTIQNTLDCENLNPDQNLTSNKDVNISNTNQTPTHVGESLSTETNSNENQASYVNFNPLLIPQNQLLRLEDFSVTTRGDYLELDNIKEQLNNCQLTPDIQGVVNQLIWKLEAVLKEKDELIIADSFQKTLLRRSVLSPLSPFGELIKFENWTVEESWGKNVKEKKPPNRINGYEHLMQSKTTLTEPIDFEAFVLKNKTFLQNDPQRELLLYPPDDISQVVLPRRYRTVCHSVPSHINLKECSLFTRECIKTYTCNWHLIHYKYSAYSGSYLDLPRVSRTDELKDEVYEVDTDVDQVDEDPLTKGCGITKQGFLLKGPDGGSDRMFVNLGHKSFKRRYCYLRREVDGTYILELHKDDKKGEAKATIVMDFCTEVVRNTKKGRFCFELRMSGSQKSYCLAAETEIELFDWINKLSLVISQNKVQEERRSSSLERDARKAVSPPQSPSPIIYGTLKGLEQSVNPQLMKYARETESSIALARRESRKRLFSIYPFMSHSKGSPSSPSSPYLNDSQQEPYKEQFGVRVLVKCEELKFKLQAPVSEETSECTQVEPYFTTLALYDAKEGRKISENFHFNVNSPEMCKLMEEICGEGERGGEVTLNNCDTSNHSNQNGTETNGTQQCVFQCKQAVMSVIQPHSEIYLVLRIDKMLQGNVIQVAEPYIRSAKDPKLALKTYKSFRATCQRIRKYRMPFAWTARPLFRLYSDELDTTSDFPALYRQDSARLNDEEILKILADYRRPDRLNKLTVIPGRAIISVSPYKDPPLENTLTSDLLPLKPFPQPPTTPPTIEVAPLYPPESPHTVYSNTLYVYPESLAYESQKTFTRARNIACVVQLRDSDAENAKPLKNIYSRFGSLTHSACCAVLHHAPSPSWYDEIKVLLPHRLSPSHHLLFTFRHISIEGAKKKEGGAETCVGYVWVPLLNKGRLNLERQCLPVASHLPPGYLSVQPLGLGKGYAGPDITWVDCQRPLYSVSFTLNSTVFTTDVHLHNLFSHGERLLSEPRTPGSPVPNTNPPPDTETCKILKAAHAIQLSSVVQFLPTILNHVFRMLVRVSTASQDLSINIIRLLVHLVYLLHDAGRTDALATYAKFVLVGDIEGSTVHEQLCAHLPSLLRPNNTDFLLVNKFLPHSGFFFQIIVKSMAQYLLTTGRIKMHRNERFPQSYLTNVESLLNVLSPYIISKHKDMPQEVQQLNASVAFFLKKCLSLMDRGFVFRLVNSHLSHFGSDSESRPIQELKFAFLQIVSSHEHFVSFNLPILINKSRQDLSSEYCLSEEYCRQHYLTGLLLSEVRIALNQVLAIRRTGVLTLRDVMAKHELDDRYQNKDNGGQLARIAMLYLPWLSIAIDNLPRLTAGANYKLNPLSSVNGSEASLASSSPSRIKSSENMNGRVGNLSNRSSLVIKDAAYFATIAGQGILNGGNGSTISLDSESLVLSSDNNSSVSMETAIQREDNVNCTVPHLNRHSRSVSGTQVVRCDKLSSFEVKDILTCFLFLVKHLAQDQLIAWWSTSPPQHVLSFFKIIELCLYEFKYSGKRQIASVGSRNSGTNPISNATSSPLGAKPPSKANTLPARMQPPDFTTETGHALLSGTNSVGRDHSTHLRADSETNMSHFHQALLEANLATEVGLICLDCLGLYSVHFKDTLLSSGGDNPMMRSVLELYLCFLSLGQSESLFRHVFASLRSFIDHFSLALFQGNAVLCGRLCLELLRCCNSRLSAIRQESCAILYLLMRSNFEFSNRRGLTRVHLQMIISVSQLLGNIVGLNNARFQESLSLINSYATSDKVMKGTGFPVEVKDLTKRIRTVLMATAQMKELHHDPEVLSDLHHSLANSYASTPELRFTWLETMTRNHAKDNNFSEAACCQLHMAALMAQYLKLKGVQSWGAEAFDKISTNIPRDETGLKLDSGVHEVHYTEQSLLDQLEKCAPYLEQSERYELLPPLYRLILPLYEARRDYEAQAQCYKALHQACCDVVTVVRSGKRLLGRFYRVAFFGQEYFEEEHGVEFVYKEPKVTSLSEVSERLLHQYTNKFGNNTVKIIMDSVPIDANELDPKIAHIQVTSVTPHFDKLELETSRPTEFEQNHNVSTFMFETPFTKDGSNKPRAEPCDQWKRRTIITTEYAFPYVKKRLKVVSKRMIELSPIEVALDEMTARVAELADVVFTKPTDPKKLQLRLQGSVCVQVNAGPLAYATAFLNPALDSQYPDEKIEELKDVFREFVRVCYAALQLNSTLVRADQSEYQAALRANFHKLCTDLSNLFQETLWPDTELGSFKRNSQALFSAISGANSNSSSA
uniref:Dedicator of cytokinesis protein 9 n=1 Tax=Cacopsylla melanoneura TaxID=428564 RepID=A0A8D9FDQ4_9HEMI